jgi:enoyl-CoA hydratase
MTSAVLTEEHGDVLVITINRPEARNAVNGTVAAGVVEALDRLDAEDALGAGVLTGAGGTFCSGMDLKAFLSGEVPFIEGRGLAGLTEKPPRKPLVAAVEGYALAGGFELLLACDLVVVARDARLGVPEVKRGLVAAAGAAILLPERVGLARAMELLLTGEPIEPERALDWGLINRVVEPGEALDAALELAAQVAGNGPLAVAASKQVARAARDWSGEEMWQRQTELVLPVLTSADAQEGAAAFAEKRAPRWQGR